MLNLKSQESKQLYDTTLLALGILQLEHGLSVVIFLQHINLQTSNFVLIFHEDLSDDCLEFKCNMPMDKQKAFTAGM